LAEFLLGRSDIPGSRIGTTLNQMKMTTDDLICKIAIFSAHPNET
jgi:hypothetical protein